MISAEEVEVVAAPQPIQGAAPAKDDWFNHSFGEDTTAGAPPLDRLTEEAQHRAEAAKDHETRTTSEILGDAVVRGTVGYVARTYEEAQFVKNPGFRLPHDAYKEWVRLGIEETQWPLFDRAVSADHYHWLMGVAREDQMAAHDLERLPDSAGMNVLAMLLLAASVALLKIGSSARGARARHAEYGVDFQASHVSFGWGCTFAGLGGALVGGWLLAG